MPTTADRTTGQIPTPSERLEPRAQLEQVVREANRLLASLGSALRDLAGEGSAEGAQIFNHLSLGNHRLMGLAEATADDDAPTWGQVQALLEERLTAFAEDGTLGDQIRKDSAQAHDELAELLDDDHTIYALLVGRAGGQTLKGGVATTETLTLKGNAVDDAAVILNPAGGGVTIGGGTAIKLVKIYTPTLDPASIPMLSTAEETYTVTGLAATDTVVVVKPTHTSGVGIIGARAGTDQLILTWINVTGGAVDPPSETYTVLAFRT